MKKRIDPKLPIPDPATASPVEKALFAPDAAGDRIIRRLNEIFRESDDGTLAIYDEGTYLGQADGLNFVGTAVTASASTSLPTGIFDVAVTSTGGGTTVDTLSAQASEDLAAGALVNIWSSSGSFRVRNADANSGSGHEAIGWVDSSVASGATATIRFLGKNTHSTGLTPGPVFLGHNGAATSTAPSTAGYLSQEVGVSESSSSFAFEWHPDILIATPTTATYGGTLQSQEFTSSGTFNVPANVTAVWITAKGAGGGGGSSAAAAGGGGGGAGELCQNFMIPVTSSGTLSITIGAKGTGGTAGGDGSDGGDTVFGSFSVKGGKGGFGSANVNAPKGGAGGGPRGAAATTAGNPGASGALGSSESPCHFGGSSGGAAGTAAASGGGTGGGAPAFLTGGAAGTANGSGGAGGGGAASIWGNGGAGGAANSAGSSAASTAYGAGGGGASGAASSSRAGGDGAPGYCLVAWVS